MIGQEGVVRAAEGFDDSGFHFGLTVEAGVHCPLVWMPLELGS